MTSSPPPIDAAAPALPARAILTLRGYGDPTGDRSVWPLNETDLQWFTLASRHRRTIRRAVALFRGIAVLGVVCVGGTLLLMLLPFNQIPGLGWGELILTLLISIVTAVASAIGAWGIHRNQRWGPILVAVMLIVTLLAQIAGSIPSMTSPESALVAIVGNGVATLFTIGFLVTTYRSARAITQLRACPAWSQEALTAGGW
ncbi:MAG: hypothetical protein ACTHLZ_19405 [Tepidisphaeraceae bacterium]